MAFNVMTKNCDDHTKNFAFRLKQGGIWELAPAYDVTHAYNPKGEWTYQHLMSVNGKFREIGRDDLMVEAERFGVRRPRALLADVRGAGLVILRTLITPAGHRRMARFLDYSSFGFRHLSW
jgi:serine/threonine-protein kinase HipA